MSRHFAHGKNMVRWKQCTSDYCPCCSKAAEDKTHILQCNHKSAQDTWTAAINTVQELMKQEQSDPQLIQLLTMGLQAWHDGTPLPNDLMVA